MTEIKATVLEMVRSVQQWARTNASNDYMYGTPQSYFASALSVNLINKEQYEQAKNHFGNLWNYRGD